MILITTHTNADFDALSSMVAALRLYPGAKATFSGAAEPLVRRFLKTEEKLLPSIMSPRKVNLEGVKRLVCVDVSSRARIGPLARLLDGESPVVLDVFDHHLGSGDLVGERHEVMEAGACTTVMVRELLHEGIVPTPFEATLFLVAIYEDTGFLSFPTTRPNDFEAVLQCLAWGAELPRVSKILKRGLTEEQMRLLALAFESLEALSVGGIKVYITALNIGRYVPDLSLLIREIMSMEGLECIFFLAYMESRVHVIARSATPLVDVASVLGIFGGGGHPSAASAVVHGKTLAEVRALLVDEITSSHPVGMKAGDVMIRTFQRIVPEATIRQAFRLMNRSRVNALPVFDKNRLLGVVTRQEVDGALQHELGEAIVSDFIVQPPPLFPPGTTAEEIRRQMLEHNWRVVLVGETGDDVEGLISRMNLFKTLYRQDLKTVSARTGGRPSAVEVEHLMASALPGGELKRIKALGLLAAGRSVSCLLVGGAVRDLLLGSPVRDVDFVVEGDAAELATEWAKQEGGRVRAHHDFGTAVWIQPGGRGRWDFATARAEYYEAPAALPTVAHAALYQDLYRRDFTMNTLALDITPEHFGEVLDLFGGVRDLKAGRIRVLHGLSFVEDPTRTFRAVRFAVKLGFSLSAETKNLIAVALKQKVFDRLSPKRVLSEVRLILSSPNVVEGLKLLEQYGLLRVFWPSLKLTPKVVETLYDVRKALAFFETQFPKERVNRTGVYLMALAERLPAIELEAFRKRYPFSQDTKRLLASYRSDTWHALKAIGAKNGCGAGRTYRALSGKPVTLGLFIMAKVQPQSRRGLIRDFLARDRFVKLLITGHDLLAAGIPPSSTIASAIEETKVAKVDGKLLSKKEELEFALARASHNPEGIKNDENA